MDIGPKSQLKVENSIPGINHKAERNMMRFRLMILINELADIPVEDIDINNKNYFIEFKLFG